MLVALRQSGSVPMSFLNAARRQLFTGTHADSNANPGINIGDPTTIGRHSRQPSISEPEPGIADPRTIGRRDRRVSVQPSTDRNSDEPLKKDPLSGKKVRLCKIPLALLLLIVTVAAAAGVMIPAGAISASGADETVNAIVRLALNNYAVQVVDTIRVQFSTVYTTVQSNSDNVATRAVLNTIGGGRRSNFNQASDMIFTYAKSIERSSLIFSAGFFGAGLLDNVLVSKPDWPGLICHSVQVGDNCLTLLVQSSTVDALGIFTIPLPARSEPVPSTWNMALATGFWDEKPLFVAVGTIFIGIINYYQTQWPGLPLGQGGAADERSGNQIITIGFNLLNMLLENIAVPPNAQIAVFLETGDMLASNTGLDVLDPASVLTSNITGVSYAVDAFPAVGIAAAAKELLRRYGNYTSVPTTSSFIISTAGTSYVETRPFIDSHGLRLIVLVVLPHNDLLGTLDSSRRKVLATSLGIGAIMLLVAMAASVAVTAPIRRLTNEMTRITTQPDFGGLGSPDFGNDGSVIREVGILQEVFSAMLRTWEIAIEANRMLTVRRPREGSVRAAPESVSHGAAAKQSSIWEESVDLDE
ncbi:hypothetical protein HKX48_009081 [Thoreauomyces humboldtii]|nr:hypothetical protein HKX48_009081 [Thoreauomyces humboldtii]